MPLRILLADDSTVVRRSVGTLLARAQFELLAPAANGAEAVRLAGEMAPDLVILNYAMPGMNGIDAARAIRRMQPTVGMILLTVTVTECHIAAAFGAGIRGYVLKFDVVDDLIRAIDAVRRGATYVSPGASRVVLERYLLKPETP